MKATGESGANQPINNMSINGAGPSRTSQPGATAASHAQMSKSSSNMMKKSGTGQGPLRPSNSSTQAHRDSAQYSQKYIASSKTQQQ